MVSLAVRSVDTVFTDDASSDYPAVSNWVDSLSSIELRKAKTDDPNTGIVLNWLEHTYEPTTCELQLSSPETRALWLIRDYLKLRDGALFYSWANHEGHSDCFIVPTELRPRVLYHIHDPNVSGGHLGQKKTLD